LGVSEILSTIRRLPEILDLRGRDTADAGALPLRRRLARGAFEIAHVIHTNRKEENGGK